MDDLGHIDLILVECEREDAGLPIAIPPPPPPPTVPPGTNRGGARTLDVHVAIDTSALDIFIKKYQEQLNAMYGIAAKQLSDPSHYSQSIAAEWTPTTFEELFPAPKPKPKPKKPKPPTQAELLNKHHGYGPPPTPTSWGK